MNGYDQKHGMISWCKSVHEPNFLRVGSQDHRLLPKDMKEYVCVLARPEQRLRSFSSWLNYG